MSIHLLNKRLEMLLQLLINEELNVVATEEEMLRCKSAIRYHEERIEQLQDALKALESIS